MSSTSSESETSPSLDAISNLPGKVVDKILTHLPQKDAVRTSILSTRWRHKWLTIPNLVFEYPTTHHLSMSERYNLVLAVYQALLLHQGPLVKFSFSVSDVAEDDQNNYYSTHINHWLHFLSKIGIQDFTLCIRTDHHLKLPCHLYSFQELRFLNLCNCVFKPPPTFKGFDRLVSLEFRKVVFPAERFGIFISNCPLLERLTLEYCPHFYCLRISAPNLKVLTFYGSFDSINLKNTPLLGKVSITLVSMPEIAKYYKDKRTSNLIEVISCVPGIQNLSAELHFFKFLAVGTVQKRLSRNLQHLTVLHLSQVCFAKLDEVSCALCLIRSCPNLQELTIKAITKSSAGTESVLEYLRVQDFSECSLNQLQEVKMHSISGVQTELEFMKILLLASTTLQKLEILPSKEESFNKGFQILRELIRFRRASDKAEIVYLEPETD